MIVTDPEDSDDGSETLIIAEDKPLKKLANVVVHKDIVKVTPILNDLLVEGSDDLTKKNIRGGSVSFLPSDIDGLQQKLKLPGAQYKAGNKTTRNELVAVLDALKRLDQITDRRICYN